MKKYLVGGAVRDKILGIESSDLDYATPLTKQEIIDYCIVNKIQYYLVNERYNTVVIKENDGIWKEVTTFRRDKDTDGRQTSIEYTPYLREDLARRDFTINAIGFDEQSSLYTDPFDGRKDLHYGIIKTVGNPEERFTEDFLRIIRAIRFAIVFNFTIEENTYNAMKKLAFQVPKFVSVERVVAELEKLFEKADNPSGFFDILDDLSLLQVYFPLLYKIKHDMTNIIQNSMYHPELYVWDHIMNCLDHSPKEVLMRWTVLTHDLGKMFYQKFDDKPHHSFHEHETHVELVDEFFKDLKVSTELVEFCKFVMANHMTINAGARKKTLKRMINSYGFDKVQQLVYFCHIDIFATSGENKLFLTAVQERLNEIRDYKEPVKPIVDGLFIIEKTGLQQGREIGKIKELCYEYQLDSGETDKEKIWENYGKPVQQL